MTVLDPARFVNSARGLRSSLGNIGMLQFLKATWALQIGILLLMLGNGMHATLLGIRGTSEFESTAAMSWIMSGYFIGFLGGSRLAPQLILRVGHVRVFAALGSLISAALILFAAFPDPFVWFMLRIIIGFCFSGVYVVAESWLNDKSTNETRGQALSVYMIVQMIGVVSAQGVLNFGDPNGYFLFVIASVLVSVSFAPILLSVSPAPIFATAAPMSVRELIRISPLGAVGSFCLGALFAGIWGMGAVFGIEAGLSTAEIAAFIASIYLGGMLLQFPIGWISDKFDRRILILASAAICASISIAGVYFFDRYVALLTIGFFVGGIVNPLYSLIIAYANDSMRQEDMASGAGCMVFINGVGAIGGPLLVGALLETLGAHGFFVYLALVTTGLSAFAIVRMSIRPSTPVEDPAAFSYVVQSSSPVAADMAQDFAVSQQETQDAQDNEKPISA